MNSIKKLLSAGAALLLLASPASALAMRYDLGVGDVEVVATGSGQRVVQGSTDVADDDPIITGTGNHSVTVTTSGGNATVTLRDLDADKIVVDTSTGNVIIYLEGNNVVSGSDPVQISGSGETVSVAGNGSLTAGGGAVGVAVDGDNLSIDGGTVIGKGSDAGVQVTDGTLTFHEGEITGQGSVGIDLDNSNLVLGDNVFILDGRGRDITADVLADPTLLDSLRKATIATKDIAVFPDDDMSANVHLMTTLKKFKYTQTGEPDAEAMAILSKGMTGECIYKATFDYTDELKDHKEFQLNVVLPKYAGKHVYFVTIKDGEQVVYDREVANNGIVWCHPDHLGDFAVFLAK